MSTPTVLTLEEILPRVQKCVVSSTSCKLEDVTPTKTLIDQLGVDSIDLIDMIFEIERDFDISLSIFDFETQARGMTGGAPFEVDQKITAEGFRALQEMMPEVPPSRFKDGMMLPEIPLLFTVQTLCNMVQRKLRDKAAKSK